MQHATKLLVFLIVFGLAGTVFPQEQTRTDAEIRRILISQSLARYSGSCPCPYNTDRAGRRCGGRSAHSRAGGASPLCYDRDITDEMVEAYRKRTEQ